MDSILLCLFLLSPFISPAWCQGPPATHRRSRSFSAFLVLVALNSRLQGFANAQPPPHRPAPAGHEYDLLRGERGTDDVIGWVRRRGVRSSGATWRAGRAGASGSCTAPASAGRHCRGATGSRRADRDNSQRLRHGLLVGGGERSVLRPSPSVSSKPIGYP